MVAGPAGVADGGIARGDRAVPGLPPEGRDGSTVLRSCGLQPDLPA